MPKGGSGAFSGALARLVEDHGGVILTNKSVARLIVENGRCTGVECADGSQHRADKAVLSTVHIKHLVDMAPAAAWGDDFVAGVATWQNGPTLFVTHYATSEPPRFAVEGGMREPMAIGILSSATRALRMSYDYARGEANLEDPDPACRVPDARRSRPRAARQAHRQDHRVPALRSRPRSAALGRDQGAGLRGEPRPAAPLRAQPHRRQDPGARDREPARPRAHEPAQLARLVPRRRAERGAVGGACVRCPGWASHRMPIPGLYQTGSTTHPGGSISAGPGRNAAAVMLKDFGTQPGKRGRQEAANP